MYKLLLFISPPLGLGKKCPNRVAYKVCTPPPTYGPFVFKGAVVILDRERSRRCQRMTRHCANTIML